MSCLVCWTGMGTGGASSNLKSVRISPLLELRGRNWGTCDGSETGPVFSDGRPFRPRMSGSLAILVRVFSKPKLLGGGGMSSIEGSIRGGGPGLPNAAGAAGREKLLPAGEGLVIDRFEGSGSVGSGGRSSLTESPDVLGRLRSLITVEASLGLLRRPSKDTPPFPLGLMGSWPYEFSLADRKSALELFRESDLSLPGVCRPLLVPGRLPGRGVAAVGKGGNAQSRFPGISGLGG